MDEQLKRHLRKGIFDDTTFLADPFVQLQRFVGECWCIACVDAAVVKHTGEGRNISIDH